MGCNSAFEGVMYHIHAKRSPEAWDIMSHKTLIQLSPVHFAVIQRLLGDRGSTVVKMQCYKSESHWFDTRWCHWNFSLT